MADNGAIKAQNLEGSVAQIPDTPEGPQPTLDFDDVSWGESRAFMSIGDRLVAAGQNNDVDAANALVVELVTYFSRVVVDIPREWLVSRAPAQIDWKDPASFDWLKAKRIASLQRAIVYEQSSGPATGN